MLEGLGRRDEALDAADGRFRIMDKPIAQMECEECKHSKGVGRE
jgi:hypothetical protein